MTTREAHGQPQLTGERTTPSENGVVTAAVVGALLGGLLGGFALWVLTTFHLPFMASIVGVGGSSAFGVWMGAALVMGLLFGSIADPATEYFASVSSWLTERVALFRTIGEAVPAGNATAVGLLYGIVMGDVLGLVAVPYIVIGEFPPAEAVPIVFGYAVFGLFLGFGYEHTRAGTIPLPSSSFLSPGVRGAVFAPVVAGAISGAIVYAGQPLYLRFLATIPGYGTLNAGFGIWMALSFVFGLVFAAVAYGHAARENSTTGYGFVYGVVLAVFVGLLAIPAAVSATTQYTFGFGDVGAASLLGFVVYGVTLGSLFGKTVNRQPLRPTFLVGRTRATVIAALVAGGVSGAVVYSVAPVAMFLLGFLPGVGAYQAAGFATWIGIGIILGCGFAVLPARRVERQDYPGQTGFKLGLAYGILFALPVGAIVVPRAVEPSVSGFSVAPLTQGVVLGSWVLFGLVYGITYGAIKGHGRVTPLFLQGREVPVLGGALLGGAAGGAVAYAASVVPGFYLQLLGGAIGVPTVAGGLAVFFGIALLAGLAFVPFAARTVESNPGVGRGLGVGAVYGLVLAAAVGVFLVPAATAIESPHTKPPVAGYFVLGLVFGGVYGVLRRRTMARQAAPTPTAIGSVGQRAIVFGSLFGGAVGGLVMYHMVAPVTMLFFSSLIGYGSYAIGWMVWFLVSLLLGGAFAVVVGPRIDRYVDSLDSFTERDEDLEAVFGERFEHAPLTTTATIAGFVYGVVAAIAVGAIAFPLAINAVTGPNVGLPVPTLQPYFLLAFVVFGTVMGLGYGIVKEF